MTHDDLKNVNWHRKEQQDAQILRLAIETPHGSQLNIFQTREQAEPDSNFNEDF